MAVKYYNTVALPTWSLNYLINGEISPDDLPEDIAAVDAWVSGIKASTGATAVLFIWEEEPQPYFSASPAFGLPTEVEDIKIFIDKE